MYFNDASNKEKSLFHDALDWAGTNSNELTIARFTRSANEWVKQVALAIWKASGLWKFSDANASADPFATATMTESTESCDIPTAALKIRKVEVKDANGIWHEVHPLDMGDVHGPLDEYMKVAGLPKFYLLAGRKFTLKPAPTATMATLASGLKVYFDQECYEFTVSDTTKAPGFDAAFHRIISIGPAYDWVVMKDKKKAAALFGELQRRFGEIPGHYATKVPDAPAKIRPRRSNYQ